MWLANARSLLACLWVSLQIREVWNTYELDLVSYQNKCRLIRGWDDLFNKVKEHINSVSAMKLSPYYKVRRGFPPAHPPKCPQPHGDVPGGPAVKTPGFNCREYGFDPWSGN